MNFKIRENITRCTGRSFRRLPLLASPVIVCLALCSLAGCGSNADPRGTRVAVKGAVTLDGEPISSARIVFVSTGVDASVKATGLIQDGVYEITQEHGPLVGENKVEIHPQQLELEEFEQARGDGKLMVPEVNVVPIPARYSRGVGLKAEVVESGDNQFDFQLVSQR